LTQHPFSPLQDRHLAQIPTILKKKNAYQRDVREVIANAYCCAAHQTTARCMRLFYQFAFYARQQFPSCATKKFLPPENPFLWSISHFFRPKSHFVRQQGFLFMKT